MKSKIAALILTGMLAGSVGYSQQQGRDRSDNNNKSQRQSGDRNKPQQRPSGQQNGNSQSNRPQQRPSGQQGDNQNSGPTRPSTPENNQGNRPTRPTNPENNNNNNQGNRPTRPTNPENNNNNNQGNRPTRPTNPENNNNNNQGNRPTRPTNPENNNNNNNQGNRPTRPTNPGGWHGNWYNPSVSPIKPNRPINPWGPKPGPGHVYKKYDRRYWWRNIHTVPSNWHSLRWRKHYYRYHDGNFYNIVDGIYHVVLPVIGLIISSLPDGASRLPDYPAYYQYHGVYYTKGQGGYVVTDPPLGACLAELPYFAEEFSVGSQTYFEYGGIFLIPVLLYNGDICYQVVGSIDDFY